MDMLYIALIPARTWRKGTRTVALSGVLALWNRKGKSLIFSSDVVKNTKEASRQKCDSVFIRYYDKMKKWTNWQHDNFPWIGNWWLQILHHKQYNFANYIHRYSTI
jgi:hypothetical protein